ncbi:exodeoxyribonuclease VII large subunit [Camelimonas abortus]|uniref:Exodeoxyribonuclease 7 large subunit n=1 Tax=Camelimonas abortus TaxID=1017184 RepID=A0ABV7LDX6_9HYPH
MAPSRKSRSRAAGDGALPDTPLFAGTGAETAPAAEGDAASAASNAHEWTVSALSGALKRTLEDQFGHVRLRGEVSGYRGPHSSGHCYFALKDDGARIDAVIWRTVFARLRVRPEEGMEVIATGRITTFPGQSKYQIVVEHLEPAGAGALMALLEERRRRLAAEGLFDEARKRPLPFLPRVIGVITSPTGAVIRDILHRLADRFPRRVIVWPVRVQGETSAAEVAAAIAGFNALPEGAPDAPLPRPDVLVVARGGGSLEDLWSFNDEAVVRAAAASAIPLVSAVGHETDWTLIDHAADLRAPTPTAAAEKIVPVRLELLAQLADLSRRQTGAMARLSRQRAETLRALARALPRGHAALEGPRQRLDLAAARLQAAQRRRTETAARRLAQLGGALARHSPWAELRARRARFDACAGRVAAAWSLAARQRRNRLEMLDQMLRTLSYHGVLARGFALVRTAAGAPVRSADGAPPGTRLELQFADGAVRALATRDDGAAPEEPRGAPAGGRRRASKRRTGGDDDMLTLDL